MQEVTSGRIVHSEIPPEELSVGQNESPVVTRREVQEIQEALHSQAGRNLLAALKAARDAVNLRPNNPNGTFLLVVGTASHRSFAAAMTSRSSQPFYGADRADFPLLGSDFIEWQIRQLPYKGKIPAREVLLKGFSILGVRPKTFRQVLLEIQHYEGTEINQAFLAVCRNQARADAAEFLEPLGQSDVLTKLLFTEIAKAGPKGCSSLFSTNYLEQLTNACGKQKTISASTVQGKLLQMQKNDWIYPSGYGCYAVSDPQAGAVWLEDCDDGRNLLSDSEKNIITANRKNYRKFDFKFGYCLLTVYLLSTYCLISILMHSIKALFGASSNASIE